MVIQQNIFQKAFLVDTWTCSQFKTMRFVLDLAVSQG